MEIATRRGVMNEIFEERLSELEDASSEGQWKRISMQVEREFTRPGLDDIVDLSRAMFLSHPLIRRAINVTTYYTFGQGVSYNHEDDTIQKEIVEKATKDPGNRRELYGHQQRMLTDVDQQVEGNTFFALFTDLEGNVKIRSFPTKQIREIYHKDGDERTPMLYLRQWSETYLDENTGTVKSRSMGCLYPDWLYRPKVKPAKIGRIPVRWDAPIMHKKSGGLKSMQFGVPEVYSALDWARAYKQFLENWHTLVASLAKFAWKASTKGSKLKEGKEKLRSHLDDSDTLFDENEGPAGGIFMGKKGDDLTAIPKTGAHTSAEDARPSRLMVASATDLPETILSGDVDIGNFATSKTLDRPTWLRMRSRQFAEKEFEQNLFRYMMDAQILAPGGTLKGTIEYDSDGCITVKSDYDDVKVAFPPILQEDLLDQVKAIIAAATLEGKSESGTIPPQLVSKMLLETLEVEDVQQALDEIDPEERKELNDAVAGLTQALASMEKEAPNPEDEPPKPKPEPPK
jgi:hypothetical protein